MAIERQHVVATALGLLDDVGMDGLTMRVLAKALDVQAPTLYWHFPSKQDLFDHMADALIAPIAGMVDRKQPPIDVLRSLAGALRTTLLSHRDGARIYAGSYMMGKNVLAVADIALAALLQLGLSERDATDAMFNLVYYVLGFTIEEQGFLDRWPENTDIQAIRTRFADIGEDRFPAVARCLGAVLDYGFDARFARGVSAFMTGLTTSGTLATSNGR